MHNSGIDTDGSLSDSEDELHLEHLDMVVVVCSFPNFFTMFLDLG